MAGAQYTDSYKSTIVELIFGWPGREGGHRTWRGRQPMPGGRERWAERLDGGPAGTLDNLELWNWKISFHDRFICRVRIMRTIHAAGAKMVGVSVTGPSFPWYSKSTYTYEHSSVWDYVVIEDADTDDIEPTKLYWQSCRSRPRRPKSACRTTALCTRATCGFWHKAGRQPKCYWPRRPRRRWR